MNNCVEHIVQQAVYVATPTLPDTNIFMYLKGSLLIKKKTEQAERTNKQTTMNL